MSHTTSPNGDRLTLDREDPYQQIVDVWSRTFERGDMPKPSVLRTWASEAIATVRTLSIPQDKRGHAWSMLVSLYWKSLYPDWPGPGVTLTTDRHD